MILENFLDKESIIIKSGDGGDGITSFIRYKGVTAGGPDGGDGGNGGNVYFVGDRHKTSLIDFKYKHKFVAENGGDGAGAKFHGKNGADIIVNVPEGTLIKDAASGKILKDMSDCEDWICAKGGCGGWGNKHFATPTRQIPMFAKDRTEEHPIVIGGGPCTYNPEPLADFFDIFYIGEGETEFYNLMDKYKEWKASGKSRKEFYTFYYL